MKGIAVFLVAIVIVFSVVYFIDNQTYAQGYSDKKSYAELHGLEPIIDEYGNVVGVAVSIYGKNAGVESFNFGVKSSSLRAFANSNSIRLLPPSYQSTSKEELGRLVVDGRIYLECWNQ